MMALTDKYCEEKFVLKDDQRYRSKILNRCNTKAPNSNK
jgi:hypothetical protein